MTYTPLPNSALAWVAHLPGSARLERWAVDVSGATDRVVSLYHNGDAFVDETGEPHSAWVVISVGTFVDSHYCALFDNAAAARKFYDAEVELNEEWVEAMLE